VLILLWPEEHRFDPLPALPGQEFKIIKAHYFLTNHFSAVLQVLQGDFSGFLHAKVS
jgi:hypothetical protein